MQDNEAYRQWRAMAVEARKIQADPSIPLWQKTYKVPGAYRGLELNALRFKDRNRVMNTLQKLNQVLAPYQFESFDAYQRMSEQDIQKILLLVKRLAPRG